MSCGGAVCVIRLWIPYSSCSHLYASWLSGCSAWMNGSFPKSHELLKEKEEVFAVQTRMASSSFLTLMELDMNPDGPAISRSLSSAIIVKTKLNHGSVQMHHCYQKTPASGKGPFSKNNALICQSPNSKNSLSSSNFKSGILPPFAANRTLTIARSLSMSGR